MQILDINRTSSGSMCIRFRVKKSELRKIIAVFATLGNQGGNYWRHKMLYEKTGLPSRCSTSSHCDDVAMASKQFYKGHWWQFDKERGNKHRNIFKLVGISFSTFILMSCTLKNKCCSRLRQTSDYYRWTNYYYRFWVKKLRITRSNGRGVQIKRWKILYMWQLVGWFFEKGGRWKFSNRFTLVTKNRCDLMQWVI